MSPLPDRLAEPSLLPTLTRRQAWALVGVCVVVVGAGVLEPQVADLLLRVGLIALVAVAVALLADRLLRPLHEARDPRSPFDRLVRHRVPAEAPMGLQRLESTLGAGDTVRAGAVATVPLGIQARIRGDAARRLLRDHGLDLRRAEHLDRIEQVVAPDLWALIRPADDPREERRDPRRRAAPPPRIPLQHLPRILDDLEAL